MFDIKGLEELQSGVRSIATNLRPEIQQYVGGIMEGELPKMIKDAPYRTGRLRKSGSFKMGGGKGILAQIKFSAPYAGFVNGGTYRMRPRPFATNGYNRIKSKLRRGASRRAS